MTLVFVSAIGFGFLLIASALENTSIVQTAKDVWSGDIAHYDWTGNTGASTQSGAQSGAQSQAPQTGQTGQTPRVAGTTGPGGVAIGSSAGPSAAQWQAYHQAVVEHSVRHQRGL